MADLHLGIDFGKDLLTEVTTGTSDTNKDINIKIRSTAQVSGLSRSELVRIFKTYESFIESGGLDGAGVGLPVLP